MRPSLNELSNCGWQKFDSIFRDSWTHAVQITRALLPTHCLLCGRACGEMLLCVACLRALPTLAVACPVCALPSFAGAVCGSCLARPPTFAATLAACVYAFPVDRLIHELKYRGHLAVAVPLGAALAAAVRRREPSALPDIVVPLPLARARQRQRGFNQAVEIARIVARRLDRPLRRALDRPGDRPAQATLPWRERRRNVRGAFVAHPIVAGRHVAVVDDVMTTGATIEAAADALLRAGASRVDAWVVARALPPGSEGTV